MTARRADVTRWEPPSMGLRSGPDKPRARPVVNDLERLTKRLRSRQAGAAGARNRHVPRVHSGSERAVRAQLTAARYVLLAALGAMVTASAVDKTTPSQRCGAGPAIVRRPRAVAH
nr:hypothetical protein XACG102_5530001 [Xanthomonas citri pv. citri]CEH68911.1 hypothetical protein XACLD7_7560001 [Xanthomonas citri pv. citri]